MNVLVTYVATPSPITQNNVAVKAVPDTTSVEDYITELANQYVDEAVTEDCALDKPVREYLIVKDAPQKTRVFCEGELVLSISAQ